MKGKEKTKGIHANTREQALENLRTPQMPEGWAVEGLEFRVWVSDRLPHPLTGVPDDSKEWGEWVPYEATEKP